ncbi:MAG: hypothetical protein ACREQ9_11460, partial [Candidatus Binatia bacterium]
ASSGRTFRHKAYLSGRWVRTESEAAATRGASIVSILDTERRHLWVVMPGAGCSQQSYEDDPSRPQPWARLLADEELVGAETIDGHPTRKYRRRTTVDGRTWISYVWRATDLQDFPLRTTNESGRYEMSFRNVVLGAPDPKLFAPPAECRPGSVLGSR